MKRLPEFIIIGAMKCATTTLHAQLAAQPQIFVHGPAELDFFSDDETYARGIDWYESLFEAAATGDLCGERSTEYTKLPAYTSTVPRMLRALPDTKFIYMMRNPLDRLVSHYRHEWILRHVSAPIDVAIEAHPEFVSYGCYDMQLAPYLRSFGHARVLPVFFERFVAQPQEELERICRFVGYGGSPRWDHGLGARNVSEQRVRRGALEERILGIPFLKTLRRQFVPEAVRNRIRTMRRTERPEIAKHQRERLRGVFDEDLDRLGRRLGIRLSCENFKDVVSSRTLDWAG